VVNNAARHNKVNKRILIVDKHCKRPLVTTETPPEVLGTCHNIHILVCSSLGWNMKLAVFYNLNFSKAEIISEKYVIH
jgi:hypothetical protein